MLSYMPIDDILPALRATLATQPNAVLAAAPGAGKTTRVPLALLQEPWLTGKRIVMLEPRRLAARAAAAFMARQLGEEVGETVGYRIRLDSKVGPSTRIEVITEGILTRMLQRDAALEQVGIIIFDEFHERSLHSDLGLALALESQALLRSDLRILVMSATLDTQAIAALLQAPVLVSEGRQFPVETHYRDRPIEGRIEPAVAQTAVSAWERHAGDILVFLPGAAEIYRVQRLLKERQLAETDIIPLLGVLSASEQDKALAPSKPGRRKIVLATSIAETSLTVEGIQTVIDSGLMRVPRFSPRTGLTRLETIPVSRAAADQRCGRAGRLGPGQCYRLWTRQDQQGLENFTKPEILSADLAPLALELAVWGIREPEELTWLDVPPAAAFVQARDLLVRLGALTETGLVTEHGRRMAEAGLHPRLAHMILCALPLGLGRLACELAALLNERDVLSSNEADIRLRVDALHQGTSKLEPAQHARLLTEISRYCQLFGVREKVKADSAACGILLAFAYPDRVGQNRGDGRFLLANGRGARVMPGQMLGDEPYIVAVDLDDTGSDSRIWLAAPISLQELIETFGAQMKEQEEVFWDVQAMAVRARYRKQLGALVLQDEPAISDPAACASVLLSGIAQMGLAVLPWTKAATQWRQRVEFAHYWEPDKWPNVSEEALLTNLAEWLGPYLHGMSSAKDLQQLNLMSVLEAMLTWDERRKLDEYAPSHVLVPSGQRIPVNYNNPAAPLLAVRLQELFGMAETPRLMAGKVPLTIQLLSPAQRPVQITRDLASFWRSTYFEVRKELQGRYPKHYWPENPLTAVATHRVRPTSSTQR